MSGLTFRLPLYSLRRLINWPPTLPFNLAVCLTTRCNLRCKTCSIYEVGSDELILEEFEKIFKSIGPSLHWATLTGGEPFLRDDIDKIFFSLVSNCRPKIVNIATNGSLPDQIVGKVRCMALSFPQVRIIVNLSIDDIGPDHDRIRSREGSYARVLETFGRLKSLGLSNLSLGINTTISRFNEDRVPKILGELLKLEADSYIAEAADKRAELNNLGLEFSPSIQAVLEALDFYRINIVSRKNKGIFKIVQAIRKEYYNISKNVLSGQTTIPCYAGIASVHLSVDGHLWSCPVKARDFGDLRRSGYDFRKVFFSRQADNVRKEIRQTRCSCASANVNITNILCNFGSLIRSAMNINF